MTHSAPSRRLPIRLLPGLMILLSSALVAGCSSGQASDDFQASAVEEGAPAQAAANPSVNETSAPDEVNIGQNPPALPPESDDPFGGASIAVEGSTSQLRPARAGQWIEFGYTEFSDSKLYVSIGEPNLNAQEEVLDVYGSEFEPPVGYQTWLVPVGIALNDESGYLQGQIGADRLGRWLHLTFHSIDGGRYPDDAPAGQLLMHEADFADVTGFEMTHGTVLHRTYPVLVPSAAVPENGAWEIQFSSGAEHWSSSAVSVGEGRDDTSQDRQDFCLSAAGEGALTYVFGTELSAELKATQPTWDDALECAFVVNDPDKAIAMLLIAYGLDGARGQMCEDTPMTEVNDGLAIGVHEGIEYSVSTAPKTVGYQASECGREDGQPALKLNVIAPREFGASEDDTEFGLRLIQRLVEQRADWDALFDAYRG